MMEGRRGGRDRLHGRVIAENSELTNWSCLETNGDAEEPRLAPDKVTKDDGYPLAMKDEGLLPRLGRRKRGISLEAAGLALHLFKGGAHATAEEDLLQNNHPRRKRVRSGHDGEKNSKTPKASGEQLAGSEGTCLTRAQSTCIA